jgi:hypothetical protein
MGKGLAALVPRGAVEDFPHLMQVVAGKWYPQGLAWAQAFVAQALVGEAQDYGVQAEALGDGGYAIVRLDRVLAVGVGPAVAEIHAETIIKPRMPLAAQGRCVRQSRIAHGPAYLMGALGLFDLASKLLSSLVGKSSQDFFRAQAGKVIFGKIIFMRYQIPNPRGKFSGGIISFIEQLAQRRGCSGIFDNGNYGRGIHASATCIICFWIHLLSLNWGYSTGNSTMIGKKKNEQFDVVRRPAGGKYMETSYAILLR